MKQGLILIGIALLTCTAPAYAKPDGPKHQAHGQHVHGVTGASGHLGYGAGGCPPGLAKKNPECMPPGQYKKLFEVGQRVPTGYRGLLGFDALPYDVRSRYGSEIDPRSQYIYDQGYLYRVDPKTLIVSEILRAIL